MGAVGITLSIEPARAPPGKKRATPIALHRALTRSIMERIARMHWGTVYGRTAVSYLGDEVADGYAKPRFAASEEHLVWTFGDKAGLCGGSASLCLHIWELVLSRRREGLDELAARRGWRITSPAVSSHVMALATPYPTVGFEGHALCVPPFVFGALDWEPGLGPFFDEGSPRPTLDELSRDRRSRFVRAATAGTCGCPPCGTIPSSASTRPSRSSRSRGSASASTTRSRRCAGESATSCPSTGFQTSRRAPSVS